MNANVNAASNGSSVGVRPRGQKPCRARSGCLSLSPRHEAFAQAVSKGATAAAAYAAAGYTPHRQNAARMMTNDDIEARIEAIRAEAATLSTLSKARALTIMAEIAEDRAERASDRISAARVVGQWCGWEKGTETENKAVDTLTEFIDSIRTKHRSA